MTFLYILLAGLFGVLGHWLTRWSQGRTESTFFEYIIEYKGHTISSFFSIFGAAALIYQGAPDDLTGKALMSLLLSAYTTGYMLDSTVNKDKFPRSGQAPETHSIEKKVHEDKHKSLRDIVDSTRR